MENTRDIMRDIEKRAKELVVELEAKGGYTECHNIVGYKMTKSNWRIAKEAGFEKDHYYYLGFLESFGGNGAYGLMAYRQALAEKIQETNAPSFLDEIYIYEYLT